MKAEHKKSGSLLQEIKVPTSKWEDINVEFVVGFPQTQRQYDFLWVIVDRLTKSTHFIPVKSTYSVKYYARIFIEEIVFLREIPLSVISIRVHN